MIKAIKSNCTHFYKKINRHSVMIGACVACALATLALIGHRARTSIPTNANSLTQNIQTAGYKTTTKFSHKIKQINLENYQSVKNYNDFVAQLPPTQRLLMEQDFQGLVPIYDETVVLYAPGPLFEQMGEIYYDSSIEKIQQALEKIANQTHHYDDISACDGCDHFFFSWLRRMNAKGQTEQLAESIVEFRNDSESLMDKLFLWTETKISPEQWSIQHKQVLDLLLQTGDAPLTPNSPLMRFPKL